MDSFKNKLLIIFCVFVVITPFWLVKGFCADEDVQVSTVSGIRILGNTNIFTSGGSYVGYVSLENGYIYKFHNNTSNSSVHLAVSDDVPELNGTYNYLYYLSGGEDYFYRSDNQNTYLYFDFNTNSSVTNITVTREKIDSMNNTVLELADVVSPNAFWDIFNISINYIIIAVCVGFGLFIIFSLIRKLTKGKEGF